MLWWSVRCCPTTNKSANWAAWARHHPLKTSPQVLHEKEQNYLYFEQNYHWHHGLVICDVSLLQVADQSVLSVFINLSIMLIASRGLWLYAVVSVWLSVLWIRYKSMGRDWDGGFGDQFLYNSKHFNVYLLNLLFTCRLQFVYISSYYLLVTSYLSQSISMLGKWINLFVNTISFTGLVFFIIKTYIKMAKMEGMHWRELFSWMSFVLYTNIPI